MAPEHAFDVAAFLRRSLVAHVASAGPSVRPVWFLCEEGAFWWLTGAWSRLEYRLRDDPRLALVVDECDLATGDVRQVIANGAAELRPYDAERARRELRRYLGPDETSWDERFRPETMPEGRKFVRLFPEALTARDLSFVPSGGHRQFG